MQMNGINEISSFPFGIEKGLGILTCKDSRNRRSTGRRRFLFLLRNHKEKQNNEEEFIRLQFLAT